MEGKLELNKGIVLPTVASIILFAVTAEAAGIGDLLAIQEQNLDFNFSLENPNEEAEALLHGSYGNCNVTVFPAPEDTSGRLLKIFAEYNDGTWGIPNNDYAEIKTLLSGSPNMTDEAMFTELEKTNPEVINKVLDVLRKNCEHRIS